MIKSVFPLENKVNFPVDEVYKKTAIFLASQGPEISVDDLRRQFSVEIKEVKKCEDADIAAEE